MADIDLGADRDPARFQIRVDGVAGRQLHFQDHHRGREHRRHGRQDMPDGEIGRHLEGTLGAHAGFDDVACIHGSWIRLKFVLTQAPMSSSFRGARSANPESILPVVVMDSGPAHPSRLLPTWTMILPNSGKPEFGWRILRCAIAHRRMTKEATFSAPLRAPR